MARKGPATPGPTPPPKPDHLLCQATITPVTLEQLNRVLATTAPKRGHAAPTRARPSTSPNGHPIHKGATRPKAGAPTPLERAKAYIDKVPGAVSGKGGHQTTWEALALPIRRFDLPREAAEDLAAYYNGRCEPPWSESELAHKLNDIYSDRYNADDWGKYVAEEPDEVPPPGEEAEDSEGGLNIPVTNPKRLAQATLAQRFTHPDGPTLHHWGGTWWAWRDAAYALIEPALIEDSITRVAEAEFEQDHRDKLAAYHARQAQEAIARGRSGCSGGQEAAPGRTATATAAGHPLPGRQRPGHATSPHATGGGKDPAHLARYRTSTLSPRRCAAHPRSPGAPRDRPLHPTHSPVLRPLRTRVRLRAQRPSTHRMAQIPCHALGDRHRSHRNPPGVVWLLPHARTRANTGSSD